MTHTLLVSVKVPALPPEHSSVYMFVDSDLEMDKPPLFARDNFLQLSELRIVLLGSRDAGKSSAGNTILGRDEFDLRRAAQCVKRRRDVAGRQVTVVDTPGWWGNYPVVSTPELVKQEIVLSVSVSPMTTHSPPGHTGGMINSQRNTEKQ